MQIRYRSYSETGIGLIEVLVATVVVALGLLAVGSLQSNLVQDSRTNKTRAEAQAFANSKLEELRDTIQRNVDGSFNPTLGNNDTVGGIIESYKRTWTVDSNLSSPERKDVKVTVCWPSASCSDQVIVQSILSFDNVANGAKNVKDAQTTASIVGGPSTNAESSDEIAENIDLTTAKTPGSVITQNGKTYIVQDSGTKATRADDCSSLSLSYFEHNLWTRRLDYDGKTGDEAIELYEKVKVSEVNYCIPRIRFNGGVIIPIRGTVVSRASAQGNQYLNLYGLFTFNASETGAYCYFKPTQNSPSASYDCYVGGNCSGYTGTTDYNNVTSCPPGSYAAAKVGAGGWRGKIGLVGLYQGNSYNNVCFQEQIDGTFNQQTTLPDSAREYFATRTVDGNSINEGINKPYNCHDFLIVDGTNSQLNNKCSRAYTQISGFNKSNSKITRSLGAASNNLFDPIVGGNCTGATPVTYTIDGTSQISFNGISASIPTVSISTDGITYPTSCLVTSTSSYSCTVSTTGNSVTIKGVVGAQTITCSVTNLDQNSPSATGCALVFKANPIYQISGRILASTNINAQKVSISLKDTNSIPNVLVPCTVNSDNNGTYSTYTCPDYSSGNNTGISIEATSQNGYTVTPATQTVPSSALNAAFGTTKAIDMNALGLDFTVSALPTNFAITGIVSTGGGIASGGIGSVILSASGDGAAGCTMSAPPGGWKKNKSQNFICQFTGPYANNQIALVTSSPSTYKVRIESSNACSSTSSGTGSLTCNLANVTATNSNLAGLSPSNITGTPNGKNAFTINTP